MTAVTSRLTITPNSEKPPKTVSGWRPALDAYEPSLQAAGEAVARYVAAMERGDEPYWLTLSGKNGCGKTMLARQVFAEARRINPGNPSNNAIWPPDWETNGEHVYAGRRPCCLWFDEADYAGRLRAGQYELADSLRDDYLIVLDELGFTRDPTSFVSDAIATLAQKRLGRWMVWATNFTLPEIAQRLDARIASRLIRDGNEMVQIKAGDYALRARRAQ